MALGRNFHIREEFVSPVGPGSVTTGSFTPADNSLLVVVVQTNSGTVDAASITISGGGWTYTRQRDAQSANFEALAIFTAPVTTGASMTLTADNGAVNVDHYTVGAVSYTGYNTTTPIGESGENNVIDSTTTYTVTLSGSVESTSEVLAAGENDANATFNPGTNYTELGTPSSHTSFCMEVQTGAVFSTATWASGGASTECCACAIEIQAQVDLLPTGSDYDRPLPGRGPQRMTPDYIEPAYDAMELETFRPLMGQVCI